MLAAPAGAAPARKLLGEKKASCWGCGGWGNNYWGGGGWGGNGWGGGYYPNYYGGGGYR